MAPVTATNARTIQVCLFIVELSLAGAAAASAYFLLNILPFGASWSSRLFSTLAGAWIARSTLWALRAMKDRSAGRDESDDDDDIEFDEEEGGLLAYEAAQERRKRPDVDREKKKAKRVTFEGDTEKDAEPDRPTVSKEITDAKKFLLDASDEDGRGSKVSFPLLAVLATVILQCAVRLLVFVQSVRRSLPWRRSRPSKNGLIRFADVPLTVGRGMSSSGCSFHIFSFLNGQQECSNGDGGGGASADNSVALHAVSFDRVSVNSSHIVLNPPRRHPSAGTQSSWLGVAFEDVDMSLTILLKRKCRRSEGAAIDDGGATGGKFIRSVTIRLRIKALEVGVFPCLFDWCKVFGAQLDVNAAFNTNGTAECCKLDECLTGFGASVASEQLSVHRLSRREPSEDAVSRPKDGILSWDKVRASLHLRRREGVPNDGDGGHLRRTAAVLTFPSGFVTIDSRRARANIGDFRYGNRLAVGVQLIDMQAFLRSMDVLLRNMSSAVVRRSAKSDTGKATTKKKKKSSLNLVEVNMVASVHFYTLLPSEDGNAASVSLEMPRGAFWSKNDNETISSDRVHPTGNGEEHAALLSVADAKDISLRYEVCGRSDDRRAAAFDIIVLKQVKSKIFCGNDGSKIAMVDLGGIVARAGEDAVVKLACIKRASEDAKNVVHRMKQALPVGDNRSPSQNSKSKPDVLLSQIKISCSSFDGIVDLPESPENVNQGGCTDRVRLALLQRTISVTISKRDSDDESAVSVDNASSDLKLPCQLFDSKIQKCARHHLIRAKVYQSEASVTFCPHSSLPVIGGISSIDNDRFRREQEVTFYSRATKLTFKSVLPNNRETKPMTRTLLAKAICATFDEVNIFERYGKGAEIGASFLIPVHEMSFQHNVAGKKHRGWPMAQTHSLDEAARLVQIVKCKGSICLVEERSNTGERFETISIQFSRGSSELEIVWSPVFQWFQVSCNNRVQQALARLKTLASSNPTKNKIFSSHKTNIRIEVDPDVLANIHSYVGVKTKVHTIIQGKSVMLLNMAKYPSPWDNTVLKQITKPNISFYAKNAEVLLNDIESPIFTFEGFAVNNYLRVANVNEMKEYLSKKKTPGDGFGDDIVINHNGQPLKEFFELNLGNAAAKLPPMLHFGEVIEDIVLLPKALDTGLNQLKGMQKKPAKKYQLMSIECIIPFLDVSLMDDDPGDEHTIRSPSNHRMLRDEFRICFEDATISIERNAPREWTQAQINDLDEDNSSIHSYGPAIQGGLLSLTIKHVFCTLQPLNLATPMARIDDFAINGHLLLAGLSPNTPGIQSGKTVTSLLLCHHGHSTQCSISSHNHRSCCCSYGVSLYSAGIPVKLYADGKVTCRTLDISYGSVMNESIPRLLMDCIQRVLPPKSSDEGNNTMPLSWWDNTRFFVHGGVSIEADELSFRWLLDSHTLRDQSIILACKSIVIQHSVGLFEIDAGDINVSVTGIGYDMSVHPSARYSKPDFHLPQAESVATRARHPLIYVPSFQTQIKFFWEMLQQGAVSSGHHSVYMKRDNTELDLDKFAVFRSDGVHVDFIFDLPGSDEVDNWVALRMDVLPWFTHLNSTVNYSSEPEEKKDPFPQFRSVAVKASVEEMKIVTWFEDEQDLDGLCLIVKTLNYSATVNGTKDIVIKGPVKAALLDVTELKEEKNVLGCGRDHDDEEMDALEQMAYGFGGMQSCNNSADDEHSSQTESSAATVMDDARRMLLFKQLQQLSGKIEELDYVLVSGQIDILNQPLAKILAECEEDCAKGRRSLDRNEDLFADVDRTTWSILVSRCQLLWTLEIRDSIFAIVKDLVYTVGFMKSQIRQSQVLSGKQEVSVRETTSSSSTGEGIELPLCGASKSGNALNQSMLDYLLRESFEAELSPSGLDQTDTSPAIATSSSPRNEANGNLTLPTLDIHFSNPQVQLHSATGGSIILAMEGAHVEGRKFVHFLVTQSKGGKVSPSDLLRKTEHTYTLSNMEAYSLSTNVDVNVGLPWLEVSSPESHPPVHQLSVALEERFGISDTADNANEIVDETRSGQEDLSNQQQNDERDDSNSYYQYMYPSFLRHHEPVAFTKSGLLRPILDKFDFQSKQFFHRPPIHYSTEELIRFMKQGLVVGQDEAAIDDIELEIDLLNFNLDSYQFKTTLDVIRNVLLEPPKLHQRHQILVQDEPAALKTSSVAATEMEEVLRNDDKHRGKKGRQVLHTAAMNLLRDLEDRIALDGIEFFRSVKYTLSKLQWCIQSEDEIDDVHIAFIGFNGQHDYSRDGSIVSQFSLEDVRVQSSRPGPDSIGFSDPTSVVKSILGNERSPCDRCNEIFDHSDNDLDSCVFHTGQFKPPGIWTCCKSNSPSAPGCESRPHTGKERAAVVRVESLPKTVDGISLYSHFEVNLFPGIPSTLAVQISKSMSRLFMSYFFIGEDDDEDDLETLSTTSDATGLTDALSMHSDHSPKPPRGNKALLIGSKGTPGTGNMRAESSCESSDFDHKSEFEHSKKEAEIAFIKVWRVGYVDVNVSLGGFKRLPISSLELSVPAYSKAYEIGSWEYLGRKYLTYLIREILRSGASSGLDKFRRKFTGSASPSPVQRSDQLESSILEPTASPRSIPPRLPPISDSGPVELESFIGRHLRRPMGAADILGTPAKSAKKKNLLRRGRK